MFEQTIQTNNQQMALNIELDVYEPSVFRIIVDDAERENTCLTNRAKEFNVGKNNFLVRMPLCGNYTNVYVFDEYNDHQTFKVTNVEKKPLVKRLDLIDIRNAYLKNWVVFAQNFCYNAGNLRENDIYKDNDIYASDCKSYLIKYVPYIEDGQGGTIPTPASIRLNGIIDVNSKQFRDYTVPMRMAILCHEFAHIYLNQNPENEQEADMNGLMLYLALGYPRYEACYAWLDTFNYSDMTANDDNVDRYELIEKFIQDFEKNKILFNYKF